MQADNSKYAHDECCELQLKMFKREMESSKDMEASEKDGILTAVQHLLTMPIGTVKTIVASLDKAFSTDEAVPANVSDVEQCSRPNEPTVVISAPSKRKRRTAKKRKMLSYSDIAKDYLVASGVAGKRRKYKKFSHCQTGDASQW
ncbi:hypothetical protein BDF20DRAFT_839699 [Mycotypha africana]|uniref:uncharacterized protein n=1 Tax=Mycotypha africana TaxID=64632 RepID=UPI0023009996|nr:uncharacterized protein BDF20DRAFT_839699 [Mycotypha africana]KAI8968610.1 hypothetical protein BDF20DRAFT_839699 [Mycotypha africana]